MYKISQWILDLGIPISDMHISMNPHPGAIQFLQSNPHHINWHMISTNPSAMDIIRANLDKISIDMLTLNPEALDLILQYYPINWFWFSKNPAAFKSDFVKNEHKFISNLYTTQFLENKSPEAFEFMLRHKNIFTQSAYNHMLSANPFAYKYMLRYEPYNISHLNWFYLSENPEAIGLLLSQRERIYWPTFCKNPSPDAIHLIKLNPDKITPSIWQNPGIFELDYQAMSIHRTAIILEELMLKTLHPSRIEYWLENGMTIDDL